MLRLFEMILHINICRHFYISSTNLFCTTGFVKFWDSLSSVCSHHFFRFVHQNTRLKFAWRSTSSRCTSPCRRCCRATRRRSAVLPCSSFSPYSTFKRSRQQFLTSIRKFGLLTCIIFHSWFLWRSTSNRNLPILFFILPFSREFSHMDIFCPF